VYSVAGWSAAHASDDRDDNKTARMGRAATTTARL
jgi:hypothetical protein